MKVLVAGTGSIGKRHIQNILDLKPNAEIILIRKRAYIDQYSQMIGATVVANFQESLELMPNAFVIATPSSMHFEHILEGIKANIPLYIEKPLVTERREVNEVKNALSEYQYSGPSLSGCNLRYLPSLRMLRKALRGGKIGLIARASFHVGQWLPDWRPDQNYKSSYSASSSMGGGVINDLIHEIDAARWLLGEFDNIKALTANYEPLNIESESVACIVMGKQKGTPLVTLALDYVARKLIRRYEFIGNEGTLVWDLSKKSLFFENRDGVNTLTSDEKDFDLSRTYIDSMQEFISSVESREITSQEIDEGIKTMEIAMTAKEGL